MPKISSEDGKLPKRIGEYLVYKLDDVMILRQNSGFTTTGNLNSPQYRRTRENATEFGRVSSRCKEIRCALKGILPKRNNLAVVNSFIRKMRQIMALDEVSERGHRTLTVAFENETAKEAMKDYAFNPEALFCLNYSVQETAILVGTANIVFPKGIRVVGFRCHVLAFDFCSSVSELKSSDWSFYFKKGMPPSVAPERPIIEQGVYVCFTLVEVGFFEYTDGTYVPMEDDRTKVVVVVNVA
jgi:hypothetical protein